MILIGKKEWGKLVKIHKEYYCIGIGINMQTKTVYYRIVDELKEIGVYPEAYFNIKNPQLLNMCFKTREGYCRVGLIEIENLTHDNDIWDIYHSGKNSSIEKEIHKIIIENAKQEGIDIEYINVTGNR